MIMMNNDSWILGPRQGKNWTSPRLRCLRALKEDLKEDCDSSASVVPFSILLFCPHRGQNLLLFAGVSEESDRQLSYRIGQGFASRISSQTSPDEIKAHCTSRMTRTSIHIKAPSFEPYCTFSTDHARTSLSRVPSFWRISPSPFNVSRLPSAFLNRQDAGSIAVPARPRDHHFFSSRECRSRIFARRRSSTIAAELSHTFDLMDRAGGCHGWTVKLFPPSPSTPPPVGPFALQLFLFSRVIPVHCLALPTMPGTLRYLAWGRKPPSCGSQILALWRIAG